MSYTQEQLDALDNLHSVYKLAHRTPEHAIQDVEQVYDDILTANDDNHLFQDLEARLSDLIGEVREYEGEAMTEDKVQYFYNKLEEIGSDYPLGK